MTTISESFNSQAHTNIMMIPLWIMLIMLADERRDRAKSKRLAAQQRGYYRSEVKQQQQRYERQIQVPAPQFRVTSPHF